MNTIIELNDELLVDRSAVRQPYVQLLLAAVGTPVAKGSPWVAVSKRDAIRFAWKPDHDVTDPTLPAVA